MRQNISQALGVPPREGWAAVYWLFNQARELIYIGSSGNPAKRWDVHRRKQPWWPEVASYALEWQPTRQHAYCAEMQAIGAEVSRYNVMGSPAYREECRKRAQDDPMRRARIMSGAAAANGAPREIVDAILRGKMKSYARGRPVYFE